MAKQRKPYNPNTKYGRKKLREQSAETYHNLSPEEKRDWNINGCFMFFIIVLVVCIILYAIGGKEAVFEWLSR